MASTAIRHGAAPAGSSARETASAAHSTAAAMSASSLATSSVLATPVMSRAARCRMCRLYAAHKAAAGSVPSSDARSATGLSSRGLAPTAYSSAARSWPGEGRRTASAPRSRWQSSGCLTRWSARPALTPSTAVRRSRNPGSARSAARISAASDPRSVPAIRASPSRARSGSAAAAMASSTASSMGGPPKLAWTPAGSGGPMLRARSEVMRRSAAGASENPIRASRPSRVVVRMPLTQVPTP